MEFIIDFYKGLDTLNLIIFWGIIIVIILLLIFSMILINKNKKLKKLIEKQSDYEEELPIIKQEEMMLDKDIEKKEVQVEETTIETEKKTEPDDIIEYRQNLFEMPNNDDARQKKDDKIEMPNAPYQKNVLREMSLGQTSPIGINREIKDINKNIEIIKDLDESLNEENIEKTFDIEKTNVKEDASFSTIEKKEFIQSQKNIYQNNQYYSKEITPIVKEKEIYDSNNSKPTITEKTVNDLYLKETAKNEYLEEVSRKLAEAEIPDDIERTNYELKQEEDAIISYKELMEKKDSIQTIDEEDAVISIEELMNRNNKKQETEEISKLYNLSEEEENDNFIKELKQFRNDL